MRVKYCINWFIHNISILSVLVYITHIHVYESIQIWNIQNIWEKCLYRITDQIHKIIHRDIISKYNRGNVRLIKNFNSKTKKKNARNTKRIATDHNDISSMNEKIIKLQKYENLCEIC